jgi:hypothetical protein
MIANDPWTHMDQPDTYPCFGEEGACMWGRCTQLENTCKCMCPVCVGDTPEVYGYDGD